MTRLDEPAPRWLRWVILGGTVGSVLLASLGGIMLSLGVANPPHADHLVWEGWQGENIPLQVNQFQWRTAPVELPASPFSVDVTAQLNLANDAVWGIWLEQADGSQVVIAISGEGYVTVRQCAVLERRLEECPALEEPSQHIPMRWKQSLFLKPAALNDLSLYYAEGTASLRLNHEWMWDLPLQPAAAWGVWMRGSAEGASLLIWQSVQLYAQTSSKAG